VEEAIEDAIELIHGGEVGLEDEAIVTRDAMAFHDFGNAPREVGDLAKLTGVRADADVGGEGQSECRWIQIETIPRDDARFFKAAHALRDGR